MEQIRKIYFTVCVNKLEYRESALGELDFIGKVLELRKKYKKQYFAIKDVYKSDTITVGNTHIIRRAA